MRSAETVLNIIRERGRRGLPLDDVYRQMFNPELYLVAYSKLYRNQGAMTPGTTQETVDGMSMMKVMTIIAAIRQERYRWTPVRRVYIQKARSPQRRPLGIPTWSDKVVEEVVRLILEAYYEPQFSPYSHGFRPQRGCHTALQEIEQTWKGTIWFIEGDISQCFDSLDHGVLLSILREKIRDNRFLRLIENLLKAGYLEDWRYQATHSGAPQGSIVGPILANIYLDQLDHYVTEHLLPVYNRGERRKANPEYVALSQQIKRAQQSGDLAAMRTLRRRRRACPAVQTHDPAYRRLRYCRYADDLLLGFSGPKAEAEAIKQQLAAFLHDTLKLQLSDSKTLITHGRTQAARFLGHEIVVQQNDTRLCRSYGKRRTVNAKIALHVPKEVVQKHLSRYQKRGKPLARYELTDETSFSIVARYQQEYRGIAQFYQLAVNRSHRLSELRWAMERSLLATLARKFGISMAQAHRRFQAILETEQGPRKGLKVVVERQGKPPLVAVWGGVSLARVQRAVLKDEIEPIRIGRSELLTRLLADRCELCGSTEHIEVHHIRKLADVQKQGRASRPAWVTVMATRRRKTLVVCRKCHQAITYGKPLAKS